MGIILAVYKPQSPPVLPTPENLWEGVINTKSDIVLAVPVFIQVCHCFYVMVFSVGFEDSNGKFNRIGPKIRLKLLIWQPWKEGLYVPLLPIVITFVYPYPILFIVVKAYGGGPLAQEVGDYLAQEGVKIISLYGLYVIIPSLIIMISCIYGAWLVDLD